MGQAGVRRYPSGARQKSFKTVLSSSLHCLKIFLLNIPTKPALVSGGTNEGPIFMYVEGRKVDFLSVSRMRRFLRGAHRASFRWLKLTADLILASNNLLNDPFARVLSI